MGIDVGTQGARALIADLAGDIQAEATRAFPRGQLETSTPGTFEQDPRMWRQAVNDVVAAAVAALADAGRTAEQVRAVSVTSTSGTLCLADASGEPVGLAMMYSDTRAQAVAEEVQAAASALSAKVGMVFSSSCGLTKLCWLQRDDPRRVARARWYQSPTDVIVGWLSGEWGHTDWTNALKWGYDVVDLCWPDFIFDTLGFARSAFPQVHAPGSVIGRVTPANASQTGLAEGTLVVAGATDGNASQLASGAAKPGDWNSTLGTTLVLKGVSDTLLRDPLGRLYCHRHPDGYWSPGGASSTGADCLAQRFPPEQLPELNQSALALGPTNTIIYPLVKTGERFPFVKPDARGFVLGESDDEPTFFAAHLEGLAYVERLAYEVVEELGGQVGEDIYVAGGGSQSKAGLRIRATVLNRCLHLPRVPSGAMGAAILAARGLAYDRVTDAVSKMVQIRQVIEPNKDHQEAYQDRYDQFLGACRERGYLS